MVRIGAISILRTLRPAARWAAPLLVLLLLLLCVRMAAHDPVDTDAEWSDALGRAVETPPLGLVGSTTALGFMLLGAWMTGIVFNRLHLPRVSGYLVFGALVGPHLVTALNIPIPVLLPQEQLNHLTLVNSLAIAFIALTAGGEIRVDFLRKGFRQIATITLIEIVIVFIGVSLLLFAGSPLLTFLGEQPTLTIFMICLVIGALEVANSPAVVIAILGETRADGPLARMALTVTIFKDLLLIILFTIVLSIALNVLDVGSGSEAKGVGEIVMYLVVHLIGSIVVGGVIGVGLAMAIRHVGEHVPLFVIAAALGIALLSEAAGLESLLVALAAGFTMVNLWPQRTEDFFHSIERLALPVYCLFFAAAGAKIDIAAVKLFWMLALGIVAVRATMILIGTWVGATAAGVTGAPRRWLWTALIPQAGVSIALITTIDRSFKAFEWSVTLTSVLLAVVAFHELFGPMLMRLGLSRAGEIGGEESGKD